MLGLKRASGIVINVAFFAGLLFGPAGTIAWPRAWILLAVLGVAASISISAIPAELLQERYKLPLQRGQPLSDKIILPLFLIAFVAVVAFVPLDVFRWRLITPPSLPTAVSGLLLFTSGWWLMTWAMVVNPYAAPVVKRQNERRHRVIEQGPYRVVRHPMYAGFIPFMIGMALWLGSYAAAISALVPIILIGVRAVMEERFLLGELPGYHEYRARVRYRLVPWVW